MQTARTQRSASVTTEVSRDGSVDLVREEEDDDFAERKAASRQDS